MNRPEIKFSLEENSIISPSGDKLTQEQVLELLNGIVSVQLTNICNNFSKQIEGIVDVIRK